MKRHRSTLRTLLCVLAVLSLASTRGSGAGPAPDPKPGDGVTLGAPVAGPLPAEVFARLPFVDAVQISPDGQHWAGLMAVNGRQMMVIAGISHGSQDILTVALPDQTNLRWLRWVNDDNVLAGLDALQYVEGDSWYISRCIAVNRVSRKLTRLLPNLGGQEGADVIWLPADKSNSILLAGQNSIYLGDDFWPGVYRVDVTTGHTEHVESGYEEVMNWSADSAGTVRAGVGYTDFSRTFRLLYRGRGQSSRFRVVDRADTRKGEGLLQPFMFLPEGDHALVVHDDPHGMNSIYEVDLATQKEIRSVFIPVEGEVDDVLMSQDRVTMLGARATTLHQRMHWFDDKLAALQGQFDKALPGADVRIESLSRDQTKMLVTVSAADMPGGLYYFDVADGVLRRLALVNEAIGEKHLAPVKAVTYKARDGLDIEALLTLPVGRVPNQLPLIVMPHGGPWAQDTLRYDYWVQFLANRGYAVLQPNFRGSTGYGTEFLIKGQGQMGLAMQDDITDGVRWAVSQGIADARRVCIVGASYGGYAALWGIAKDPDLYRCAISIAGVSSLKREVNEFANEIFASRYRDEWKRMTPDFDAVSPINAIARITTPLLLVHGKKDITVSYGNSDRMYTQMRKAGKTVEFISLPLADHHFAREADRLTLLTSMETFLRKYNPAD